MTGLEPIFLAKVLGAIAYPLLEYWMGKTDKIEAGSVIEAILNLFKSSEVKGPDQGAK